MIVSHRHRYIFLHCRKTGGSSVTVSLMRDLGPLDIVIGALQDAAQHRVRPTLRAWSRLATPDGALTFARARSLNSAVKASYRRILGDKPEHAPAVKVKDAFPQAWSGYFKFCVIRNPYARVVSDYFWRTRRLSSPPTFSAFLRAMRDGESLDGIVPKSFQDNWPVYTIDDKIVVDRTVRFERLEADLRSALEDAGIPWDGWLPTIKQGTRVSYSRMYSRGDAQIVARLFEKEIETFGYAI